MSDSTITQLKSDWWQDYELWSKRDRSALCLLLGRPARGLWHDPGSTVLGSQDRQRPERHAKVSSAQGASDRHLDGANQGRCHLRLFVAACGVKFAAAVKCLNKDRADLLAFYDFPAEHWKHIRTSPQSKAPLPPLGIERPRPKADSAARQHWP
jgi:hypothetical protein